MRAALRVGTVPYLVARPLDLGLAAEPGIELVYAPPAELVLGLQRGALDVALSSSIELFRRPGYRYLDGLAVAGRGHVASVQLFLRRALADVRTVALDPASRTSAVLAEIELRARGLAPHFAELEPGADPRAAGSDAWLRIGDAALADYLGPAPPPSFNPSAAWCARTGQPFAFAVWIARGEIELERWQEVFWRSRALGSRALPALAAEAALRLGLPLPGCRRYLEEECSFELGAELGPALLRLRDEAAPLGHCRADLVPCAAGSAEHVA